MVLVIDLIIDGPFMLISGLAFGIMFKWSNPGVRLVDSLGVFVMGSLICCLFMGCIFCGLGGYTKK